MTPTKNMTASDAGIYTVSGNQGVAASYTFEITPVVAGETVYSAKMTLVNTNDGLTNTHPALVYVGTASADSITANAQSIVYGFDGNDTITGSAGNDSLIGGNGADTFVFASSAALNGTDTITAESGVDYFDFRAFLPTGAYGGAFRTPALTGNITNKIIQYWSDIANFGAGDVDQGGEISDKITLSAGGKCVVISGEDNYAGSAYIWFVHDSDGNGTVAESEVQLVGVLQSFQLSAGLSAYFITSEPV